MSDDQAVVKALLPHLLTKCTKQQDDCLIWTGPTNVGGDPIVYARPFRAVRLRPLVFELTHRMRAPRVLVSCGNRRCVDGAHLVTPSLLVTCEKCAHRFYLRKRAPRVCPACDEPLELKKKKPKK